MSKYESLDDYLASQGEIRYRFLQIVKYLDRSKADIAKDIGISVPTLRAFLAKGKDLDLRRLSRVLVYIEKKESELGLGIKKD